ncbi:tumor necrosis factor receptor superfamily member 1A [Plectropomus leopardus]|uniref:tumor necrosis factor receptor superfamily member 1A n=1 Tax=Plectropomus leopardus TaxID=160734 RepID=UPI001C4D6451|nr:tumor necrosis factor receptor superfamily member 1A [Plectropomus leopardus]
MEGAGHRGRWIKKAPIGTLLLLMCMFIPTLALLEPSEEPMCEPGEYTNDKGICCNKCSPGFKLVETCHALNERSNCTLCPDGQYTDQMNSSPTCRSCKSCKASKHEEEESPCERDRNAICRCEEGFYKSVIDSETFQCLRCKQCRKDEKLKQSCSSEKNTVCECTDKYHRVKGKCEPCKNCTAECKHLCASPSTHNTKAPEVVHKYLINIIAGVVVAAGVLVVVVALITHMVTKRSTQKKLLNPPCPPSDISSDSCEQVLINRNELSENLKVKAVPQSPVNEQDLSNLPDCVPLEVKIPAVPELIYMVLDLVPVLQVKQLVRALGVKDTEIEQAEMDHRSCREAHYQMLRVWAERGSQAGIGGRGKTQPWPLLQELLDELRKMHLGRAAEELETKYGIQ